jgi:hypothetical protein
MIEEKFKTSHPQLKEFPYMWEVLASIQGERRAKLMCGWWMERLCI